MRGRREHVKSVFARANKRARRDRDDCADAAAALFTPSGAVVGRRGAAARARALLCLLFERRTQSPARSQQFN